MTKKDNISTVSLIRDLRKAATANKAPVWKYIAELMEKSNSRWAEVNIAKLDRLCNKGAVVVVPGKILGGGEITKPLTATAFKFTLDAKKKIVAAGGTIATIPELLEKHPKGSGIVIIK